MLHNFFVSALPFNFRHLAFKEESAVRLDDHNFLNVARFIRGYIVLLYTSRIEVILNVYAQFSVIVNEGSSLA